MIQNLNQVHFWELREKVKKEALNLEEKLKEKVPEEIWIPVKKIEGDIFLLTGREFDLKKIWQIFENYKGYYSRKKEFLFLFERIKKIVEKTIFSGEEKEREKTIGVLEKVKEVLEEEKWKIFREFYKNIKEKKKDRIFLFIGMKKRGTQVEIGFFVSDTPSSSEVNSRKFSRVPEMAVGFRLISEGDTVIPQYIFEL